MARPPRPTTTEQGYGGDWPKVRLRILQRDRHRCQLCGGRANCVDHILPIRAGGARLDPRNLRACCLACNSRLAREREERERNGRAPTVAKPRRVWSGAIRLDGVALFRA